MSIDAIINNCIQDGDDLILDLMSREIDNDTRGQRRLIVKNFTYIPEIGQHIWGGSGSCIIEPNQNVKIQKKYTRDGYITLIEDF